MHSDILHVGQWLLLLGLLSTIKVRIFFFQSREKILSIMHLVAYVTIDLHNTFVYFNLTLHHVTLHHVQHVMLILYIPWFYGIYHGILNYYIMVYIT